MNTCLSQVLDCVFDYARDTTLFSVISHDVFQWHTKQTGADWYWKGNLAFVFEIFSVEVYIIKGGTKET